MIIINPKVELLPYEGDAVKHATLCARICYDKESGNNDQRLYDELIQKHHWSVFRHVTYYAIVPNDISTYEYVRAKLGQIYMFKYKIVGINIEKDRNYYYVAYNGNFALDFPDFHSLMQSYLVSPEEFSRWPESRNMIRVTFRVTTQISTSREMNRCSPNNITELSSRYVDLRNAEIVRPHWMTDEEVYYWNEGLTNNLSIRTESYCRSCDCAFDDYRELIEQFDFKREDARGVLPLDTATKVIYTYSVYPEWKHIIDLRADKRSHPNAQIIANMIKKELEGLGYNFTSCLK